MSLLEILLFKVLMLCDHRYLNPIECTGFIFVSLLKLFSILISIKTF